MAHPLLQQTMLHLGQYVRVKCRDGWHAVDELRQTLFGGLTEVTRCLGLQYSTTVSAVVRKRRA